ncbi:hypothetical protein, partial [Nocardia farcinica]|uniref:hypothetical protein n=1 Tax=Nocardia farcinica TaxID=37329 RepID=UPI00245441E9
LPSASGGREAIFSRLVSRGAWPPPPPPPEEAEALVRHAHAGERGQRAALQAVQDRRLGGRSGDVS